MATNNRVRAVITRLNRISKSYSIIGVVQTRLIVSIAVLVLTQFRVFKNPTWVLWSVTGYLIALIILVAVLQSMGIQQKRWRILPDLLAIVAVSFLVRLTGDPESAWFLLYIFPVMSASRYLGPGGSLGVAAFSALGYYYPGGALREAGLESIYAFSCRAMMLSGVALTAANLTKTRDRAEAKLLSAIEEINRQILSKANVEIVMNSILNTAMSIADSDVSAIVLV